MAMARRGKLWSTRDVPADVIRFSTSVAFPAMVDPSLGVLSALSVGWWAWEGWTRRTGALLWVTIAAGLWMGQHAPQAALSAALAVILAVGIIQIGFAVIQRFNLAVPAGFKAGGQVHGTMGHRAGLAVYLAVVSPLAFLTDYGWLLFACFAVGLLCAPSFDSALAVLVAGLILFPHFWWAALVAGLAVWASRAIGKAEGIWVFRWRPARMDTWKTRKVIWKVTWRRIRHWPAWLIGYGAHTFQQHARTWLRSSRLKEVFNECHNDWLELWYEYGLIGLAAIAWFFWRHAEAFSIGDPVTASAAALSVSMVGNFPIRVAPIAAVTLILTAIVMRRVA